MSLTTDKNDPELGHGVDEKQTKQHKKYLILSEEERKKGFIRPLRRSYMHIGKRIDLEGGKIEPITEEEAKRHGTFKRYVAFLRYPESKHPLVGRALTQEDIECIEKPVGGCRTVTDMALELCETYARDPKFYGSTYCIGCQMHLPVSEFEWCEDGEIVGS